MTDRDLHNKVEAIHAAIAGGGFESMLQLQIDIANVIHEYQTLKFAQRALRKAHKDNYTKAKENYSAMAEHYANATAPKLMEDLRKLYASMTISLNRLRAAINPNPRDVWARSAAHAAEESSDSEQSNGEHSDNEQSDDMAIADL